MKLPALKVPSLLRSEGVQRFIKAVLTLGAVAYLVYIVEPAEIAEALAGARYGYLALAVVLLPMNVLLEGAAWRCILHAAAPSATWRSIFGALFCGYGLALFTPARTGEYAGRALYFDRGDRWAMAATVFVQRLLDMLAAIGVGTAAVGWALSTGRLEGTAWHGALILGIVICLSLILIFLWPGRVVRFVQRLLPSERARSHLAFLQHLGPGRMSRAAALSWARYVVFVTQFVLLARAFSPNAPLTLLYGGAALVFFAKFLLPSLTMMDVGIREGAAVFFLSTQFGLPQATGFNAAFFLFLTNLVLPAALGAPFLTQLHFEKEEERSSSGASPSSEPPAERDLEPADTEPLRH